MNAVTYEKKEIPETNGYTVDTLGVVRNKKGIEIGYNANGYRKVTIAKNSTRKQHYVHILVAEAFILKPDTEDKLEVNHVEKDTKCDNRVENLEWVTSSQNKKHAYTKGENKSLTYFNNHEESRKTVTDIWMLKFNEPNIFYTTISSRLNISINIVKSILKRESWTNITDELSKKYPIPIKTKSKTKVS
ncbi:MAG: HNH endonuclease [Methylococcales bacterium]